MIDWLNTLKRRVIGYKMKLPSNCRCELCGRPGYNPNGYESWLGASFVCRGGCYPADVRAYQLKKIKAARLKELEVSDGAGI